MAFWFSYTLDRKKQAKLIFKSFCIKLKKCICSPQSKNKMRYEAVEKGKLAVNQQGNFNRKITKSCI